MEDSPIGLDKWLAAIWLIANAKNGISSHELHRSLGVTQKSAWFLLHRIRKAMQQGSFAKMSGHVEVDETFIGGKARFMHKSRRAKVGKTGFVGNLQRTDWQGDGNQPLGRVGVWYRARNAVSDLNGRVGYALRKAALITRTLGAV
jgi:hypothetical protein